jgi:hypothetical protein
MAMCMTVAAVLCLVFWAKGMAHGSALFSNEVGHFAIGIFVVWVWIVATVMCDSVLMFLLGMSCMVVMGMWAFVLLITASRPSSAVGFIVFGALSVVSWMATIRPRLLKLSSEK